MPTLTAAQNAVSGLAASSPVVDGRATGMLDTRLDVYRQNSAKVPSITGGVVPEAVFTQSQYREQILGRIYADLAPLDPKGVLAHEWVNARGAIARFDRMAIEIRTVDLQECPMADLAVAELIVETLRSLVSEQFIDYDTQRRFDTERLSRYHQCSVEQGGAASWPDADYLRAVGLCGELCSVAEVWAALEARVLEHDASTTERDRAIRVILQQGTLAARILRALGPSPDRTRLRTVYQQLAECLAQSSMFEPNAE